jgi:uncharacterized membrane protein (TIGR01666 family)
MDYLKEYRSFINSHYLSEGVRKTAGILLPTLIMGHFDLLQIGMTISLGALCVSITDNPGPILHRINGFIVCNIIVFVLAIITGFLNHIHWLFALVLPIFCFFFSMIGVYGARATSIGIAALLIIILQTLHRYEGWDILYNSLYLLAGGTWYFLLCLVLYSIRPFKLTQQALGAYILSTADYLRVKASLYTDEADYDKSNEQLLNKQIAAQEKQNLATELIFKTRSIVKESTATGRILVMAYLDTTDLFETTMSSHQDYRKLHESFGESGILLEYHELIILLADELDEIGIALQAGRKSSYNEKIDALILNEREHLQQLRLTILEASNVDVFISLKHILDSIDDIASRIRTLHQYTSYDQKQGRKKLHSINPEDFITHQEIEPKLLLDNLSFRSNIFRHSLRITLASLAAYLIGQLLPVSHSYWILLTVVVILKPGYSLTKKRNYERLTGTVIGTAIGALFLYFIKDSTAILFFLAFCMIGAYSFIRTNYRISVTLITLYVLLMFHLLDARDFKTIFFDRIIDTGIGSVLAFIFSYLLSPIWEHERINQFISRIIEDNRQYYQLIACIFTGKPNTKTQIRVARKNSLVSLANLSDAFNQMLSEPKSKQKNIQQIHQLVVSNHMLTSHIATLAYYADTLQPDYVMDDYRPLIILTKSYLEKSVQLIENKDITVENILTDQSQVRMLDKRINTLLHIRQEELKQGKIESDTRKILSQFKSITDQFYFIYKISIDIEKISLKLSKAG